MMMIEPRAATRSTALPPAAAATEGAGTESGGATGFMMLLGMFTQPTLTKPTTPLSLMLGASLDGSMPGETDGERTDDSAGTHGAPDGTDPLGLQALARALVQANEAQRPLPDTMFIGNDPHARNLLSRAATLGGTTFINSNAVTLSPDGAVTSLANSALHELIGNKHGTEEKTREAAPPVMLPDAPTTAAAMIALATQQQAQLVMTPVAPAPKDVEDAPAVSPRPMVKPAMDTMPLTDVANPGKAGQSMVRAVMAIVNALQPAAQRQTKADESTNAPHTTAVRAPVDAAPQPMLRDVTMHSLVVHEREQSTAPVAPAAQGAVAALARDAQRGKRNDRQQSSSGDSAVPAAETLRTGGANNGGQFTEAVRTASDAIAGTDAPAPAARADVPVAKPQAPASQVTVELDPATGAGRVRVAVRGDVVHATIITSGNDAPGLDGQVHELRRALEARGFSEAHVAVRIVEPDSPHVAASSAVNAVSGDLKAPATRESGREGQSEQRTPRGPYRDPSEQRSPRRRPQREEELV